MDYGFISCIPIVVLVVGVFVTKRIAEMMILASVLGAAFVYRSNLLTGYIEMMYKILASSSYQFVLFIVLGFGMMIRLFQRSGGLSGFSRAIAKYANGPRRALFVAWMMSFFMFIDDYLNTISVSFAMKKITDKNGVPREHLAYQVSSMAPSLCVLIPFTGWTAFTIGLISEYGLGYYDYLRAIPYMYFPIITVFLCLFLAMGLIPKVGLLKESYGRIHEGGRLKKEEKAGVTIVDLGEVQARKESSALNFIIPIVVLVVFALLYENDLIHGLIAAIVAQGILYTGRGIMTVTEFFNDCFEGAKSMTTLAFILFFAYSLNFTNQAMGFSEYLIKGIGAAVPVNLLPLLIFSTLALITFATAGYWAIQVITVPVFIPLAGLLGLNPSVAIAAIMSGVTFGCVLCLYSDVLFMSAAGTGVSNLRQVKVAAPYALGTFAATAICYIITGYFQAAGL